MSHVCEKSQFWTQPQETEIDCSHKFRTDIYLVSYFLKSWLTNSYFLIVRIIQLIKLIEMQNDKGFVIRALHTHTSCKFNMVCPKSSAKLLKNVNMEVLINSGQFFTKDLASIPFTRTWRQRTVIRTSGPNAANLNTNSFC